MPARRPVNRSPFSYSRKAIRARKQAHYRVAVESYATEFNVSKAKARYQVRKHDKTIKSFKARQRYYQRKRKYKKAKQVLNEHKKYEQNWLDSIRAPFKVRRQRNQLIYEYV